MKRLLPLLILAAASILLAQAPNQATLRTPTGDRQVTVTHVQGLALFAADEVIAGLGGDHFIGSEESEALASSEEHTPELQALAYLVCRLLLEQQNLLDLDVEA